MGIWCYDSTAVTIQKCESHNNLSAGGDGDGFDIDGGCTNCIIQYCHAHGNKDTGSRCFNTRGADLQRNIIRCISEGDKLGGIGHGSERNQ